MPDISRRLFLRNASIGAVATGAVAAGGLGIFSAVGGAEAVPVASSPTGTSHLDGSGLIAHVTDAKKGQISIYVGTKQINYTNHDLAQQLLRAAQ